MVAIPAKDETSSIGATLAALARSADSAPSQLAAVVFVNNSDDGTDDAVRRAAMALDLPIFLLQGELRAPHRQAGWARRIAMDFADRLCGPDGVILTTDADTSVCPAWAGALATQLAWSADLVFGDFAIDTPSAAVSALHAQPSWRIERHYGLLQDQLRHICDQVVGRQPVGGTRPHYVEAGASIGIRADVYRRLGGLPPVPKSEDRDLARSAELAGARIRYLDGVTVMTSGRLVGRAQGGMAETVRRRLLQSDPSVDERLRPAADLASMWTNALRAVSPSAVARPFENRPPDLSAAVGHARLENEWHRALVEPPMRMTTVGRELHALAGLLDEIVRPAFAGLQRRAAS